MLRKRRGYNAIYLPWGMPFPESLEPTLRAAPLTFDQLCANMAQAGANTLRIKFCGLNNPQTVAGVPGFESRLGVFNDWDGRLPELVAACKAHGVGIHAIVFDNIEWKSPYYWYKHPWNVANGGFLTVPRTALSDPRAIDAGKRRIDAIVEMAGDVVTSWEICAEMTWLIVPDFLGVDTWNEMEPIVRDICVPWVETMAQYIHPSHPAPVGNGHVKGYDWANDIYRTPGLDFALINWYGRGSVRDKVALLRRAQEFVGRPVYVEQYAPWSIGGTGYVRDNDPFPRSKEHEWALACGEYGCSGPWRWPETEGDFSTWWGTAHPNMATIAGTTEPFGDAVDLSQWSGRGQTWDEYVVSDGLDYKSTWGDGQHVTLYGAWFSGGQKAVTVLGLQDGAYRLSLFDFLSGDRRETRDVTVEGGRLAFSASADDAKLVAYLERTDQTPPDPPPQPFYRLRVRDAAGTEVASVPLIEGDPYELVLESSE